MNEREPVPAEPRSPDESGEASTAGSTHHDRDGDTLVREERRHANDASGLAVDDKARGDKRRQQYRDGMTEVSELD